MSRQEKTILTVFALALVLSLLALLLWQETGSDEPEILHLSVLLDGSEETAWRNFRRGADAAAVEYNVDLRYVYRYENPGQVGQLQAMEAELASGAEAVAVAPLDAEALTEYLRNHSVLQPVVAMGLRFMMRRLLAVWRWTAGPRPAFWPGPLWIAVRGTAGFTSAQAAESWTGSGWRGLRRPWRRPGW